MLSSSLKRVLTPSGILFDEVKHTYTKPNGEMYVGTTTVSDAWDKSYFLGPWTAKEMALAILSVPFDEIQKMTPPEFEKFVLNAKGAAKRKSEKAKDDGHDAHAWIEAVISSKLDPSVELLPTPESKEAQNAINAFAGWAKGRDIKWLASEEVVCSDEHRFAGTLDAIAVIDGLTYLVDWKTSSQISASYLLQCAGYDIALREKGLQVMGYLIIRIPKDGKEAETLTITDQTQMEFFRQTFLKQREAHRFYVYAESKLKDMSTGKMKVDAPADNEAGGKQADTKVEQKSKQTDGRSKKAV